MGQNLGVFYRMLSVEALNGASHHHMTDRADYSAIFPLSSPVLSSAGIN
jgi:hypothetical protein